MGFIVEGVSVWVIVVFCVNVLIGMDWGDLCIRKFVVFLWNWNKGLNL